MASAATGEPKVHQDENTVSPARSLRAKAKAVMSAALLDLLDCLRHQLVHGAAEFGVADGDLLVVEVLADFPKNVVIAGLLEVGDDDFLGVSVRLRAGQTEFFGRPKAQQLVAAGAGLELQLFIMRELLFEAVLALVECGHAALFVLAQLVPVSYTHLRAHETDSYLV